MTGSAKLHFFDRTYRESMDLLIEARDYAAGECARTDDHTQPEDRLLLCCEAFRITSRLTHVMAWLLTQRAVHSGELTREEAADEAYGLGGKNVCTREQAGIREVGDAVFVDLLDRSLSLYRRVARLDDLVRLQVALP